MRYFNTEGICRPEEHYMVRLDERLGEIKRLYVDRGKYFIINRGRQYGKTTTLHALEIYLWEEYLVFSLDFQMLSKADFKDEQTFSTGFIGQMENIFSRKQGVRESIDAKTFGHLSTLKTQRGLSLKDLFEGLSQLCETAAKPVVLMIDEVDSASNNQIFIDFLAQLRGYYLHRQDTPIFRSVILAGVYDIKNLKLKLRPDEERQYNSPWNIAASFDVVMDFSAEQIAEMLREYEVDHQTGMDTRKMAEEIYQYTSGYPYLVSFICKLMDEALPGSGMFADSKSIWQRQGVVEAVSLALKSNTPLFDSLARHLDAYPDLLEVVKEIIYQGRHIPYSPLLRSIHLGVMFGYLKNENKFVSIANRMFEMGMMDLFTAQEAVGSTAYRYGSYDKNQFTESGRLDMELVLRKFTEHFADIYANNDEKFVEAYGRKFFLLYLKPIINGTGSYYLEAQTRDALRTDVIVDYLGEQYVVELKIWRGNTYNERGERQLAEYLDYYHLDKGYMLSFNFNRKKETGVKVVQVNGKVIVEAVV